MLEMSTAKQHAWKFPSAPTQQPKKLRRNFSRRLSAHRKARVAGFIEALFKFYADLNFTYLEINPVAVTEDSVIPVDLAAKLDSTAEFESGEKWGNIEFPAPFGRTLY